MTYLRLIIAVAILMGLAYLYDQPFGLTILALMSILSVSVSVLIAGQGSWEIRKHRASNFMSTTLGLLLDGLLAVIGTGVGIIQQCHQQLTNAKPVLDSAQRAAATAKSTN